MKRLITLSVVVLGLALALPGSSSQTPAATAFEKVKGLVGEWEGQTTDGRAVRVSYKLVSAGASLLETHNITGRKETTSVYYVDGDQLMLTHYCSVVNQPRLRTSIVEDGKVLRFSFLDVTNLGGPTQGHIRGLVLTLEDNDHISQEWTWRENGQEYSELSHLTRKE